MTDYEKKYNEALERARMYRDNAKAVEEYAAVARYENIFPELREGEDEKNANALIRLLNDERVSVLMTYEARQQWLDWLERKKIPSVSFNPALGFDPGSAVVYHNDESEDERIRKGLIKLLTVASEAYLVESTSIKKDSYLSWLEKHKEQKPAECIEDSVKFEEGFKTGRESGLRDGQKYVLDNAESYGLCKPAEWSEEDEKMRDRIIDILNRTFSVYSALGTSSTRPSWPTYKDEIAWLKSLRPDSYKKCNSRWKPSEEQMNALNFAITYMFSTKANPTVLRDLYDDLLKLK